jgi:nucleoside-triphosphatase THEP1
MVIIVTGAVGIGKTTVCRKLIEIARNRGYTCGGILTYKSANKDIIIESIQSGERETLAGVNNVYDGPHTVKYSFNPKGIEFGTRAIDKGTSADVFLVDEIGPLELRGEGFARVPQLIKTSQAKACVLVIRKELLLAFLPQLPAPFSVFETTRDNRDQLPQEIGSVLLEAQALRGRSA